MYALKTDLFLSSSGDSSHHGKFSSTSTRENSGSSSKPSPNYSFPGDGVVLSAPVLALVVAAFLGYEHGGSSPGISLVDSGANIYFSKKREDFTELFPCETIPISGTSGKIQGVAGTLRPNKFRLQRGVYINDPNFPLGRILPFIGGLALSGFELYLGRERGMLYDTESGSEHLVRYDDKINLPILADSMFDLRTSSTTSSYFFVCSTAEHCPENVWSKGCGLFGCTCTTSEQFARGAAPEEFERRTSGPMAEKRSFLSKNTLIHARVGHWGIPGMGCCCPT